MEYEFNSLIVKRLNNLPWDKTANRMEQQLKARNVSLALWDILQYPQSLPFKEGVRFISGKINDREVREGIKYIQFDNLSLYKKLFAYLIRYRLSVLLCFIVKHIYPYLSKRLRR